MIAFKCLHCGSRLQRPDNQAGGRTICDSCGQRLKIPVPDRCPAAKPFDTDDFLLQGEELPLRPKPPVISPASVRFSCPHCQAVIKGDAAKAGLRVKCPKCSLPCEMPLPQARWLDERRASQSLLPSSGLVAPSPPSPTDLETAGPRPIVAPNPKSRSSLALWGIGFVVLLGVGVASGLLLVNHFRATAVSNEAEIVRLKNDVHRLQTQMEMVEFEYHNALLQKDPYRAASLCDQFAARADEQATACDLLAARLQQGNDRDEYVRMAQDRRRLALTWRTCAAQIRSAS